jgi:hypothetical protein
MRGNDDAGPKEPERSQENARPAISHAIQPKRW